MNSLAGPTYELVEPMQRTMIPPARRDLIRSRWPFYAPDEIEAVVEVLQSGQADACHSGERCRGFERAFAAATGMPHAVALANGTVALELGLQALGIGAGDEVVLTPRSFAVAAACIVACGATPIFADVDSESQNLTADSVARVLTPRTKMVIAVHLAGWPCAMDEIMTLARGLGLYVIEDCAQAHGATYDGRPVGSFGDIAVFSFGADEIMSTGGAGGMLLVRDEAAWARVSSSDGDGRKPEQAGASSRRLHEPFGNGYRLTEMQAAIGLMQLTKLPEWLAHRRRNAAILTACLSGLSALRLTVPPESIGHAYYKYHAFLRPEGLRRGWDRRRVVEAATDAGVPCIDGMGPEIHLEKALKAAGIAPNGMLPNAAELGELGLMLPVDPTLDEVAVRLMGQRLRRILETAGD